MQFERPVESTAVLLTERLHGSSVPISVSAPDAPPEYDARGGARWVHPRADVKHTVPTQLLRAVLVARGLSLPAGMGLRVVSVPEMCAQAAPVAYLVHGAHDMQLELVARGPLMSSLPVTPALLAFWSSLLRNTTSVFKTEPVFGGSFPHVHRGDQVLGVVAVAIVGYTSSAVVVALSWGATCDDAAAWGHNGCMLVSHAYAAQHLFVNMVAMVDSIPPPSTQPDLNLHVVLLTLPVLQQAAEQPSSKSKLPRKLPAVPPPPAAAAATTPTVPNANSSKSKPKLKVKAKVLTPPQSVIAAAPRLSVPKDSSTVHDIAALIVVTVAWVVLLVLAGIFLRKSKLWRTI